MTGSASDRNPVEQLAEEFIARYRRGERPSVTQYASQYPQWADEIRELFPAVALVEQLKPGAADLTDAQPGEVDDNVARLERLGDYRIIREVGRGGMAVVYEAEQASLGRRVALKVLPSSGLMSRKHLERFRREARAAAGLHHSNIVPVFGIGEHEGIHYYVMQFIQGQSLDQVVVELRRLRESSRASAPPTAGDATVTAAYTLLDGRITRPSFASARLEEAAAQADASVPPAVDPDSQDSSNSSAVLDGSDLSGRSEFHYFTSIARIGLQVAEAMAYAHGQGILHRDVKPSNLLLDMQGAVWVTDFGLAKTCDGEELTRTGDLVGTLRYMAPERFRGWSDPRSDIYSLGLTLYELATLHHAFGESDRARLVEQVMHESPPRPRKVDPRIPRDLETIILKAIDKEPGHRYQTAQQLADDLRLLLLDRPIHARRSSLSERTWRWCRRNPVMAGLSASVALLLVCITLVSTVAAFWLRAERNTALSHLTRARHAENAAQRAERLAAKRAVASYLASFNQARAARWSGRAGRRYDSLEALAEAARTLPSLGLGRAEALELRNEAVACMALTDLKVERRWQPNTPFRGGAAFDGRLEQYAVGTSDGSVSVRRTADDVELVRIPAKDQFESAGVRFSPNGKLLATKHRLGQTNVVRVWRLGQPEPVLESPVSHNGLGVDFSPDSRRLAVGLPDSGIALFELAGGRRLKRFPIGYSPTCVRFHPEGSRLALCEGGQTDVRVFDLEEESLASFKHPRQVFDVAWAPSGDLLATACADYRAYVWDVATRQPLSILQGHQAEVVSVMFNHEGDLLASSGWDGKTLLWDPVRGQNLIDAPGRALRFSDQDSRLAFLAGTGELGMWKVAAGRECRVWNEPPAPGKGPNFAHFDPSGELLVTTGDDGVRLWEVDRGQAIAHLVGVVGATTPYAGALFAPDGRSLVTSGVRGLHAWPIHRPAEDQSALVIGPPRRLAAGSFSTLDSTPDGRLLVAQQGAEGKLFRLESAISQHLAGRPGVNQLAISPDGKWVAGGAWHGQGVRIWDAATGKVAKDILPDVPNSMAHFTPDSSRLVTSKPGGYVFWHVSSWQRDRELDLGDKSDLPGKIAFTPDGRLMAAVQDRERVRLIDPGSLDTVAVLEPPDPQVVGSLCFSPDGCLLAVTSSTHRIHLWDLRAIRSQLGEMNLDWNGSPLTSRLVHRDESLKVELRQGELAPPQPFAGAAIHVGIEKHTQAIRANRNDAEAYHQRGHLYEKLHQWAQARDDFDKALALNPDNAHLLEVRARNHVRLASWKDALADYSKLIDLEPRHIRAYAQRGLIHSYLRQYAAAIADYQKHLDLVPDDTQVLNNLALIYATGPDELRALEQARRLAEQAVQLAPDQYALWSTLAMVNYQLKRFEEAQQAFQQAIELGEAAPASDLFLLAMCHARLGRFELARERFGEAIGRWKRPLRLPQSWLDKLDALHSQAAAAARPTP
ncbi:MAG: protein kinase [Pirellulales bacterium]